MHFTTSTALALAAAVPATFAQTYTNCNPLKKTCPKDAGLPTSSYEADFTQGESSFESWSQADATKLNWGSEGAEFVINKDGEAPTVATDFFFFGGRVDVTMKAATGQGIISSIVLQSDVLDEIDFEFLGGVPGEVQTNFFGKGDTTSYDRMIAFPVDNTQAEFHTYSVDWTENKIDFIIDDTTVRTINYGDAAANGGKNFPQTPMQLKLGNWAGGGSEANQGTVEWAGGKSDFSQAPFTMTVADVKIQNANPADSYSYSDNTGSWDSIEITKDGSASKPDSSDDGEDSASSSSGDSSYDAEEKSEDSDSTMGSSSPAPTADNSVNTIEASHIVIPTTAASYNYTVPTGVAVNGTTLISTSLPYGTGSAGGAGGSGSSPASPTGSDVPIQSGGASALSYAGASVFGLVAGVFFL